MPVVFEVYLKTINDIHCTFGLTYFKLLKVDFYGNILKAIFVVFSILCFFNTEVRIKQNHGFYRQIKNFESRFDNFVRATFVTKDTNTRKVNKVINTK